MPDDFSETNYSPADEDGDADDAPAAVVSAALDGTGPGHAALPAIALRVPENPGGQRIDRILAQLVPQFSRARLQAWLDAGRVSADGIVAGARTRLRGGEALVLRPVLAPELAAFTPEPLALDIVFEDAAVIVINKPAGLVVHPAAGNWNGTLLNGLLHHAPALAQVPRAGIVHRLDKDTSGLMVVARTLEAQTALVRQLQARSVRREYLAIAAGHVQQGGSVAAPIGRHPTQRTLMAVLDATAAGAKPAITHYTPLTQYARGATLVACRLETGRTHQIRVHLRHLGHPLLGDPVYGTAPTRTWFARQALHARTLAFVHPASGATVTHEAAPPHDFAQLMRELEAA